MSGCGAQFIDDVLDWTGTASQLGKPALADIKSGLATAPVLFAAEEFPELTPMIQRKFKSYGDVATAQHLVLQSKGIERARDMAGEHAGLAAQAVCVFVGFYSGVSAADSWNVGLLICLCI